MSNGADEAATTGYDGVDARMGEGGRNVNRGVCIRQREGNKCKLFLRRLGIVGKILWRQAGGPGAGGAAGW